MPKVRKKPILSGMKAKRFILTALPGKSYASEVKFGKQILKWLNEKGEGLELRLGLNARSLLSLMILIGIED